MHIRTHATHKDTYIHPYIHIYKRAHTQSHSHNHKALRTATDGRLDARSASIVGASSVTIMPASSAVWAERASLATGYLQGKKKKQERGQKENFVLLARTATSLVTENLQVKEKKKVPKKGVYV